VRKHISGTTRHNVLFSTRFAAPRNVLALRNKKEMKCIASSSSLHWNMSRVPAVQWPLLRPFAGISAEFQKSSNGNEKIQYRSQSSNATKAPSMAHVVVPIESLSSNLRSSRARPYSFLSLPPCRKQGMHHVASMCKTRPPSRILLHQLLQLLVHRTYVLTHTVALWAFLINEN
jgi:hypothetical protein